MPRDNEDNDSHENYAGIIAAMLASGVVLWWLLGCRPTKDKRPLRPVNMPAPMEVWLLDDDGIEIDGARADLPTTIRGARMVGAADVYSTRDARRAWIERVSGALLAAGVNVRLMEAR